MYEARYDATDYTSHGGIARREYLSLLVGMGTVAVLLIFGILIFI
jgi:hypothetical protein